jgi:hypothetical protein
MPNRTSDCKDIERLTSTVEDFCGWIESLPAEDTAAQEWGPREVLAHLVYWHEHYLSQSNAILKGQALRPPAGRFAGMNARAVEKFHNLSIPALTKKFRTANRRLCGIARGSDSRKIAFSIKQGSKRWRLSDLLPAAEAHVRNHKMKLIKNHPPRGTVSRRIFRRGINLP